MRSSRWGGPEDPARRARAKRIREVMGPGGPYVPTDGTGRQTGEARGLSDERQVEPYASDEVRGEKGRDSV